MEISRVEQSMQALFVEISNLVNLEQHFNDLEKTVIQECSIKLNKLLLAKLNALGENETTPLGQTC